MFFLLSFPWAAFLEKNYEYTPVPNFMAREERARVNSVFGQTSSPISLSYAQLWTQYRSSSFKNFANFYLFLSTPVIRLFLLQLNRFFGNLIKFIRFNTFSTNVQILHPLKTSENCRSEDIEVKFWLKIV